MSSCRWTRSRLPLLAGDDLATTERRKVERHLIGCPTCRARSVSLAESLTALRSAAGVLARTDSESLWPELNRQIRRSRHEPNAIPFGLYAIAASLFLGVGAIAFSALPRSTPPTLEASSLPVARPALPPDNQKETIIAKTNRPSTGSPLEEPGRPNPDPQRSY